MDNWDDLRYCLALYRFGTMTDAAKMLGANVATVSRRIQRLTEELGQTIFVKEGSAWVATDLGQRLAQLAQATEDSISLTRPQGTDAVNDSQVRISCAVQVMQCGLLRELPDFLDQHEHLRVRLLIKELSLALNECDIRVGFVEPEEGRLVRRRLGEFQLVVACGRSFANKLTDWIRIMYAEGPSDVTAAVQAHFGKPSRLEIEGLNLARTMMQNTGAAAMVPKAFVAMHDDLVEIPIGIPYAALPIWVSYHDSRRLDPIVRLAVDFIETAVRRG